MVLLESVNIKISFSQKIFAQAYSNQVVTVLLPIDMRFQW